MGTERPKNVWQWLDFLQALMYILVQLGDEGIEHFYH
jgi:hypothetical protein